METEPIIVGEAERLAQLLREAMRSLERARHTSISQAALADELGVSLRTMQDWLGKRRTPSATVAMLNLLCLIPDPVERLRLLKVWEEGRLDAVVADSFVRKE